MSVTLRTLTRRQRARIYVAALSERTSDFALDAALACAAQVGLGAQLERLAVAGDAVRYSLACHGLVDSDCALVAITHLNRGVIPRPGVIIRQARRDARRMKRATLAPLADRLAGAM